MVVSDDSGDAGRQIGGDVNDEEHEHGRQMTGTATHRTSFFRPAVATSTTTSGTGVPSAVNAAVSADAAQGVTATNLSPDGCWTAQKFDATDAVGSSAVGPTS